MAIWGAVFPILTAFAVYFGLWFSPHRPGAAMKSMVGGTVGFAAVSVVCYWLLIGRPSFPPREAMHWLPLIAALGAALGCLDWAFPALRSRYVTLAVVVLFGVILPRAVPMTGKAAWLPTTLLVWALLWSSLRIIAAVPTRFVAVIAVGLLSACSAAAFAGSASTKQGLLAGAIAFGALGVLVVQTLRPGVSLAGPAVGVVAAVLAAALGQSVTYGSTPKATAMLVAGASVAAAFAATVGMVKPSSWKRVVVMAATVILIAGAGVAVAVSSAEEAW